MIKKEIVFESKVLEKLTSERCEKEGALLSEAVTRVDGVRFDESCNGCLAASLIDVFPQYPPNPYFKEDFRD